MFGNKNKKIVAPAEKISAQITSIPKEFYGGGNPVVYQDSSPVSASIKPKKNIMDSQTDVPHMPPEHHMAIPIDEARKAIDAVSGSGPHVEKTKMIPGKAPKAPKQAEPQPTPSQHHILKKPLLIGVACVLLLVIAGGATWYLIGRGGRSAPIVSTQPPSTPPPMPQPSLPTPSIPSAPTSTPVAEPEPAVPTTTPGLQPTPLLFPRVLLADSEDLDTDALTDSEESLFGTDVGIWDSDADGYYDGQEVVNLYNPNGFAPVRLIDSGFVRDYTNPQWQYHVYYPISWDVAPADMEDRQVLFSAITGDFIEVRVMDRRAGESFAEWFGREAIGQRFTDLQPLENRFQEQGMIRNDNLVAYFTTDTHMYILIYNPGITGTIPYRHVMEMMYQSFRPGRNTILLPAQRAIPAVPISPPTTTISTTVFDTPSSLVSSTEVESTGTSFGDF